MRRNLVTLTLTGILTIILTLVNFVPVVAQGEGYESLREPFTVDTSQPGTLVTAGSTIHHLANGITEVYSTNNSIQLRTRESDARLISTPGGLQKANRVYRIPNNAKVSTTGNTTKIYRGNDLILTIVDEANPKIPSTYAGSHWIEQANTGPDPVNPTNNYTIDWFDASWTVPVAPVHHGDNVMYYFTGLMTSPGWYNLIQPVLQWNQTGQYDWAVASWDMFPGGSATVPGIQVSAGDSVRGQMVYQYGQWVINTWKEGSTSKSSIAVSTLADTNLIPVCTLEGWNFDTDNDTPGSGYFTNMTIKDNNNIDPGMVWYANTGNFTPVSELGVVVDNNIPQDTSWVTLLTHNLSVVTNMASNIASTTATLNGNLDRLGSPSPASANVSFEYGLTTSINWTPVAGAPSPLTAIGAFSANLTGLSKGKTYHFRAKAVSSAGMSYGAEQTFTTNNGNSLVVVTNNATIVTINSAKLNGAVTSMGSSNNVTVSFEYGLSTSYGVPAVGVPSSLTAPGTFTANITGLYVDATYHYRAKAGNKNGDDQTFHTSAIAPEVTTNAALPGVTSATISGNLTNMGSAPSANTSFDWGLASDNYTNFTTVQGVPSSLNATGSFSATISPLSANTTYHFRAKATAAGSGIVTFGNSQNFTTLVTTAYETLRPSDNGSETSIDTQYPGSGYHWDKVDESSPDEDSTYVENKNGAVGSFQRDLYAIQDHSLGSGPIDNVRITTRSKFNSPSNSALKISLKTHGVVYDYDYGASTQSVWTNISRDMPINPFTGLAWTWAEVDALEAGVSLGGSTYSPDWSRVTQVYVVVAYSSTGPLIPGNSGGGDSIVPPLSDNVTPTLPSTGDNTTSKVPYSSYNATGKN